MKMLIIYVFMRWAEPLQEKLVRDALAAMRADVRFVSLTAVLDELDALYNDWQKLASESASRDVLKIQAKNAKKKETMNKLYTIAMQVNIMCAGTDLSLAAASGLPLRPELLPVTGIEKPVILEILRTVNSGVVELIWTSRRGVITYIVESTIDGGTTWVNGTHCKRIRKKIGGFTPGVVVAFRVKAIGTSTESDWSDSKSILMA